MKAARQRLDAGAPVKDATRSVGDWLAHWRATTLAASDRKESTRALHATLSRCHLEPQHSAPSRSPPAALSDATIRQVYTVLRAGPDGAVRGRGMLRNAAALVRRPGLERREARHLDDNDVTAVLRAAEASRHHATLVLIAATGLRRVEALALRWDRVDLDALVTGAQPLGLLLGAIAAASPRLRGTAAPFGGSGPSWHSQGRRHDWARGRVWCSSPSSAARSSPGICYG